MLPNFRVPIELTPGQRHALLVQDVPACVFWQGFPERPDEPSLRAAHAHRIASMQWFEHILARVMVRPRLTVAQVRAMGRSNELPTQKYLEAIGWWAEVVTEAVDAAAILDLAHAEAAQLPTAALEAFRAALPPPSFRRVLTKLADAMRVPVTTLWGMPMSEFMFGYWCYLEPETRDLAPLPDFHALTRPPAWAPQLKDGGLIGRELL